MRFGTTTLDFWYNSFMESMIVGIGGVSCSGKTVLINALKPKLPKNTLFINFDDYYIHTADLETEKVSWESPEHFRYEDFVRDIKALKTNAHKLIIVEGFLIFYDKEIRDFYAIKYYIDLPETEIIRRRISRNRGTESDTTRYINTELIPGQKRYVYPQREFADIVLDGQKPVNENIKVILDNLNL